MAVQGPGVRVVVTPGTDPVGLSALLDTIQELRTAGAEAIEVNDTLVQGLAAARLYFEGGDVETGRRRWRFDTPRGAAGVTGMSAPDFYLAGGCPISIAD